MLIFFDLLPYTGKCGEPLFRLGWGIGGFCPGPALTSAGAMQKEALVFVVTMTIGMMLYRIYQKMTVRS